MPKVKIKLSDLRYLVKEAAEYHRLDMKYGCCIVTTKTGFFTTTKTEKPFKTWQEAWQRMIYTYPWNELQGILQSENVEGYFVEQEVEISLKLAGQIGYCMRKDNV